MTELTTKQIEFIPNGRGKAQCAADPNYPTGIHVRAPESAERSCFVTLPYPAPERGMFLVTCATCSLQFLVTAAGRTDDPVSVELPCLPVEAAS